MAENYVRILQDIGSPIAYFPSISRAIGNNNAGIFLSQMMYWEGKQENKDGWIRKTHIQVEQETGISRHELDTIRRKLKGLGIMEELKMGVPARLHYRFNWDRLNEVIHQHQEEKPKIKPENKAHLLGLMKDEFDRVHNEVFPELDGYEWIDRDFLFLKKLKDTFKKRLLKKEPNLDKEQLEKRIVENFRIFLDMLPEWERNNWLKPQSLHTNFSTIAQNIYKKHGVNKNRSGGKSFADQAAPTDN